MSDILLIFSFILVFAMIGAALVILTFGMTQIFGAPYVPTPKRAAREMLKFAGLQPGEIFVDLGSGSGTLLFTAVGEFGVQKAIGFEINPLLVAFTRLHAKFRRRGEHVEVKRANFFKSDVGHADIVATYLWPGTMDRLRKKLKAQLRPGTRIISRGFTFTGVEPVRMTKEYRTRLYLYRVEDL